MGTITYHKPVGIKAVDSIREHCFQSPEEQAKIVAMTATREAVFVAYRTNGADEYIPEADGSVIELRVFKLALSPKSYYNFGYKDMDESMGPYGCEAPLSLIANCSQLRPLSEADSEYSGLRSAHEYRARCKAIAEAKAMKRTLKNGDVVTLSAALNFAGVPSSRFEVVKCKISGRSAKQSTAFRNGNGTLCSIRSRNLIGAVIESRAA